LIILTLIQIGALIPHFKLLGINMLFRIVATIIILLTSCTSSGYIQKTYTENNNYKSKTTTIIHTRSQQDSSNGKINISKSVFHVNNFNWKWKPYIKNMQEKLYTNWVVPEAYLNGNISGNTIMRYSIDRNGNLVKLEVLKHEGDKKLEESSIRAIKSLFPIVPLPKSYPDSVLIIEVNLKYPAQN